MSVPPQGGQGRCAENTAKNGQRADKKAQVQGFAHQQCAANGGDERPAQLHDGGGWHAELPQNRIPQHIAQGRGKGSGGNSPDNGGPCRRFPPLF